jgi:hypothetical protein
MKEERANREVDDKEEHVVRKLAVGQRSPIK